MTRDGTIRQDMTIAGKRVLIVEDEVFVALDLQARIEDAGGIVVGPVTTLHDALLIATHADVDVAIMDVELHGEISFPAADILVGKGTPFLWHSGFAGAERFARDYPDAPVIEKPSEPEKVLEMVTTLAHKAA